jgi:hypothetical protein
MEGVEGLVEATVAFLLKGIGGYELKQLGSQAHPDHFLCRLRHRPEPAFLLTSILVTMPQLHV